MALVEVIKGQKTSSEVFERTTNFINSLGKIPVRVQKDIPGFVMNRIFSAAFKEAIDLVAENVASIEDIDIGMRLGYGWSAGPFEIADNSGLDTWSLIFQSLKAFQEQQLIPHSDLIEKMVVEGRIGKKAGRGFYDYTSDGKRIFPDTSH
jgi:3-hydroxyacyl-CoA dehydrogenase